MVIELDITAVLWMALLLLGSPFRVFNKWAEQSASFFVWGALGRGG